MSERVFCIGFLPTGLDMNDPPLVMAHKDIMGNRSVKLVSQILVLASPARRNAKSNPYNELLSDHLEAECCRVEEFTLRRALIDRADIVHIHWPQSSARGSLRGALKRSLNLWFRLAVQKIRGAKVVWTVHNIHAHDQNNMWLERLLMAMILPMVDGLVFLSESSRSVGYTEIPSLAAKPHVVIPHGVYGDRYSTSLSSSEAREQFGLPVFDHVIGFIGDIRPNKGLFRLLTAVESIEPETTLFIAGQIGSPLSFRKKTEEKIKDLQRKGHRIVFRHHRLGDAEMAAAIRACDIIAMPYREIANSGLAILVLEHGARILASDAPIFREIQREVGGWWIQIVDGEWTGMSIESALRVRKPVDVTDSIHSFRQRREWPEIAAMTRNFYDRLLAGR